VLAQPGPSPHSEGLWAVALTDYQRRSRGFGARAIQLER
jgi:hypothetical protein